MTSLMLSMQVESTSGYAYLACILSNKYSTVTYRLMRTQVGDDSFLMLFYI